VWPQAARLLEQQRPRLEEEDRRAHAREVEQEEHKGDGIDVQADRLRQVQEDAASHEEEDDEGREAHVAIDDAHALHVQARCRLANLVTVECS
jgi:hypothetical protein